MKYYINILLTERNSEPGTDNGLCALYMFIELKELAVCMVKKP